MQLLCNHRTIMPESSGHRLLLLLPAGADPPNREPPNEPPALHDLFALRAACRAYHTFLPLTPSNLAYQAPLLLVPHLATGSQVLFHLSLRHLLRFRLPDVEIAPAGAGYRFNSFHPLGCSVVVYDITGQLGRRELRIVHMLTGEEARLPKPTDKFYRVLLSGDLVLAWRNLDYTIRCCPIDAAEWRVASISISYLFEDSILVKGTLYALITGGELDAAVCGNKPTLNLAEFSGELVLIRLFPVWSIITRFPKVPCYLRRCVVMNDTDTPSA
ncbi:hypothetical protein ACP70R_016015 [Stipagrostis hirtigluma subsp. patula]